MNIFTLIGVLVGFIVLGVAIYAIFEEHVNIYWGEESLQGLLLVLGCVTAATFISYPFREVRNVMKVLRLALTRDELPVEVYTQEIETLSGEALQRGTSRLKGAADEVGSQFLEDGLRMVVDKYTAEDIREIMTEQIKHTYQREMGEAKIFRTMVKFAPAFGVVGTLIESIKMMLGLSATAPKKMLDGVSTGMAAALLTTFYGVILSNLIFSPIALKVEKRIEERIILMDIIMEGTLLILEKTPPALVHDQLKAFLLLLK